MTRQKLSQPGWEVLSPLHSPDIALLDFYLFWSLQNSLNGKNFSYLKDCERHLEQFFSQKDKFGKMEVWSCLKDGRGQWNKTVNILFSEVTAENEKCLIFTELLDKPIFSHYFLRYLFLPFPFFGDVHYACAGMHDGVPQVFSALLFAFFLLLRPIILRPIFKSLILLQAQICCLNCLVKFYLSYCTLWFQNFSLGPFCNSCVSIDVLFVETLFYWLPLALCIWDSWGLCIIRDSF